MSNRVPCFVLSIFFCLNTYASTSNYTVEVDAGSSGSRVYLLKATNTDNQHEPQIDVIYSHKVSPGLSSFAQTPEKAAASIHELLSPVSESLIKDGIDLHRVSVNILATGGMRLLPQDQQNKIYNAITDGLEKKNEFAIGRIATISGQEEAKYLWLTINYLKNNNNNALDGVIDLGGASSQIAYVSKNNGRVDVHLNGKAHKLFAKSVLGVGSNEMRRTIDSESCFPFNYPLPDGRIGTGNYQECYALTKDKARNILNNFSYPEVDKAKHFIAVSGFYYAADYLNLKTNFSASTLKRQGEHFCRSDWKTIVSEHPKVPAKYLSTACALMVDSAVLLEVYGLANNNHIQVADKINQQDVSWVIGALLANNQ